MADTNAAMPAYGTPFLIQGTNVLSEPWFRFLLAIQARTGGSSGGGGFATQEELDAVSEIVEGQGKEIDGQAVQPATPPYVLKPADPLGVFIPPPQNIYEGNVVPPFGTAAQAAAGTFLRVANNLSDVASASTSRTNLGLGTAAVQNVAFFLQTANNLSDVPVPATARTNLGLGTIATQNANAVAITGGSVNGTTVGAGTPSTGAFTTITASSTITPNQTAGIVGTTTNNNANAGSVGEFVTATGTTVSLTTATAANITSISLTAGDWDVCGTIQFVPAGTTTVTLIQGSASLTSATQAILSGGGFLTQATLATGQQQAQNTRRIRVSVAATTTVFLVATASFGVSTMTANGILEARRIR